MRPSPVFSINLPRLEIPLTQTRRRVRKVVRADRPSGRNCYAWCTNHDFIVAIPRTCAVNRICCTDRAGSEQAFDGQGELITSLKL